MARPAPADDFLASPLALDREAERAIVGAILARPAHAPVVMGGMVSAEHFHDYACAAIAGAMEALVDRGEPADVDGIARELFARGVSDVGKIDLVRMLDSLPGGTDYAILARRVREGWARRTLRHRLTEIAAGCGTGDLGAIREAVLALADATAVGVRRAADDRWSAVAAEIQSVYDSGADDAIPSGFIGADRRFGAWPRKSLVIAAARTSVGKTALATTLATTAASAGRRVSFISVEMDRRRIGQRYLGALAGISVRDLKARALADGDFAAVAEAAVRPLPLCTDDAARRWADVRSRIRQHARELGGLDLAIVDYVQLVDVEAEPGERRYQALGRLSHGLKRLAQDLDCVVLALAQLNRGADDREEPRLSDLRESGDLEQDADVVWLLWRAAQDRPAHGLLPVRLKVGKNRDGPVGELPIWFRADAMTFLELADGDEDRDDDV